MEKEQLENFLIELIPKISFFPREDYLANLKKITEILDELINPNKKTFEPFIGDTKNIIYICAALRYFELQPEEERLREIFGRFEELKIEHFLRNYSTNRLTISFPK